MRSYARRNKALARQYYQWMVAMHYARTTQKRYRKIIFMYIQFMGERSIAVATQSDIRKFIAHVSEGGASLNTVYQNLGVLRLFYDFLNLGGVVSYVAPRFVRLRQPWRNRLGALTESQVQRMISAAQTLRERALVEFLYATGCRLSEAVHLRIENVDFGTLTAKIRGKLGKTRLAILTKSAAEALRVYIGDRTTGYVFREDLPIQKGCLFSNDGKWMSKWSEYSETRGKRVQRSKFLGSVHRMSHEVARKLHDDHIASLNLVRPIRNAALSKMAIQQAIKHIAVRAGLKKVTPHTFRRTFATHLYDHGAGVEVIKALMGHVWVQTTLAYMHIGPDRLAKTFEQCHPREKLNCETSGQFGTMVSQ